MGNKEIKQTTKEDEACLRELYKKRKNQPVKRKLPPYNPYTGTRTTLFPFSR